MVLNALWHCQAYLPPVRFLAIAPLILGCVLFIRIVVVGPQHAAPKPMQSAVLLQRQLELQRVTFSHQLVGTKRQATMPLHLNSSSQRVTDGGDAEETEADENDDIDYSELHQWGGSGRKLRWRGVPYPAALQEDGEVYGGDHTTERFAARGFEGPVMDDSWNVLFTQWPASKWLMRHPEVLESAQPSKAVRLVNHCEYYAAAGDKCAFAEHLSRVASFTQKHHHLRTFELHDPEQYSQWQREAQNDPHRHWIIKGCTNGASQGIKLLQGRAVRHSAPAVGTWAVAQEFLAHPYLGWGGHKFHLRLYALVTRWDPVGVVLFNNGLVFRSRAKYHNGKPSLRKDIFSSVSKQVRLLELGKLWQHIDSTAEVPSKVVRERVVSLLKDVLGSGLKESFGDPRHLAKRGFSCFDLFGVDVILDQQLEPYVLEVNIGPNLWLDADYETMQRRVKGELLDQVAHWAQLRIEDQSTANTEPTLERQIDLENMAFQNFERLL